MMKNVARQILIISSVYLSCLVTSSLVQAQISPDNTLPTNVNQLGKVFEITGGAQAGNNLFHSFKEFSVPNGSEAFFRNATTASNITNIISRVTGGSISIIDGLIKENYGANFILINPSGINFGPNAQLNIGGSFLGSTANSLKFADGAEFSASDTQTPPLLTVSVPVGLQFGQSPAAIRLQGTGHNISLENAIFSPFTRGTTAGLKVQPGHTLALVGGDIISEGGTLTAESGRIELGSVAGGLVSLNPNSLGWTLGYQGAPSFQDISLSQKALADTSGIGSGSIQLQGRNISIRDGSIVLIQTQGVQPADSINVNASESLELIGTTQDGRISSNIFTETIGGGKSGDITVSTPRLIVQDGAAIASATYTNAPGGIVNVNASDSVQVIGFSPFNPARFSNITAATFGSGNAGQLNVSTTRLSATQGGNIAAVTAGTGSGGNLTVNANESVELIGVTPTVFTPSQITAGTGGPGKAGNVTINTQRLVARDGGRVDASTLASGSAGSITINAKDSVEVSGRVPGSINPSLIITAGNIVDPSLQQLLRLPALPSGNSGDVTINTSQLKVSDGGLITARNDGTGLSGNVNITANSVLLDNEGAITSELGRALRQQPFSLSSPTTQSSSMGGDIGISTQQLVVKGGSIISTITFTGVAGGNININAPEAVQIIGFVSPNPRIQTAISASTFGSGNSGDIAVSTGRLSIVDGGLLTAGTLGTGAGGDVTINATESVEVIGVEKERLATSLIGVSALNSGNGGNLTINTPKLVVRDGARVDSSTVATGSAGSITINAPDSVEISGTIPGTSIPSLISAGANIENELTRQIFRLPPVPSGNSGDVMINTARLIVTDGAQLTARNQGTGNGGDTRVNARSILLNNSGAITAATQSGEGGNIFLKTDSILMRHNSQISAQAGGSGNGGNITITGFSPAEFVVLLEGSKITANAFEGRGGNIQINAQGLFACPECQITASSELGLDGQVEIITPETEANQEAIDLPQEIAKPEEVVAHKCLANMEEGITTATK